MTSTIRLLEEMALLGGFSDEQVRDAFNVSDAARNVLEALTPEPGYEIRVGSGALNRPAGRPPGSEKSPADKTVPSLLQTKKRGPTDGLNGGHGIS